jgi:hypothetical protein
MPRTTTHDPRIVHCTASLFHNNTALPHPPQTYSLQAPRPTHSRSPPKQQRLSHRVIAASYDATRISREIFLLSLERTDCGISCMGYRMVLTILRTKMWDFLDAKAFLFVTPYFSIYRHFFLSVSRHFWCPFPYFLRESLVCSKVSFSTKIQIKLIR